MQLLFHRRLYISSYFWIATGFISHNNFIKSGLIISQTTASGKKLKQVCLQDVKGLINNTCNYWFQTFYQKTHCHCKILVKIRGVYSSRKSELHLAQKVSRRFLKPAVWNYPTTLNDPETYILLSKPCPLMWHPVRGNRVWNGGDRWPETRKICLPKITLFENSYGQCAVQHRELWNAWWHRWWAQRSGVVETTRQSRSPLYWFKDMFEQNEYVRIDYCSCDSVTAQYHTVHSNFQKVQLQVNKFFVFRAIYLCHFLQDFHAQDVTLKGKALATKCIFQNYSQLLDNFTQLVLKTAEKRFVPSVFPSTKRHLPNSSQLQSYSCFLTRGIDVSLTFF